MKKKKEKEWNSKKALAGIASPGRQGVGYSSKRSISDNDNNDGCFLT
jgi:hypothetical protein